LEDLRIDNFNRDFCEELVAHFFMIGDGRHTKPRLPQFFFAAGTSLPNCYLSTIWGTPTYRLSFDKALTAWKITLSAILLLLRVFIAAGT
jgi:hypothetical protein